MVQENREFIDFSHSFFLWETFSGSEGRFQVESTTTIISDGNKEELSLLSSVMACDVYGDNPLFRDPHYLFEAVFGQDMVKVFRTYQSKTDHTVNRITDLFAKTQLRIKKATYAKLDNFRDMVEATRNGTHLLGQVRFNSDQKNVINIKFPIKHINVSEKKKEFQVETGKILFYQDSVRESILAYLSFKDLDTINFLTQDGCLSKIVSYKAEVEIYKKNNTI